MLSRVDVLGVPVTAGTLRGVLDEIERWITAGDRQFASFVAVHSVMDAQRAPEVMEALRGASVVGSDGMPIVWACRRAGVADAERVYGPDVLLALSERARDAGWRSYFYGGAPGVAELLVERLEARFPGLEVVGTDAPPYRPLTAEEDAEVVARINAARPDVVWVGLGSPKQDMWMHAHVGRIDAPAMLGVGAAFDFHAGTQPQAPAWMQRHGLEWLFRTAAEPRRLLGRYLRANPAFVARILRHPPRRIT